MATHQTTLSAKMVEQRDGAQTDQSLEGICGMICDE
jgi:hypothetical protein